MVGASQQMIDAARQRRRGPVLPERGKVGGDLTVEQGQLLKLAAGEPVEASLVSGGHKRGEPFPVRSALLNPLIGKDGHVKPFSSNRRIGAGLGPA